MNDASSGTGRPDKLDRLISGYLRAVEAGMPVDREALVAQHPDVADHLRAFFAAQDHVRAAQAATQELAVLDDTRSLRAPLDESTRVSEHDTSPANADPDADTTKPLTSDQLALASVSPRHFGDYELLEEIARGGMGVVYKARQVKLNRIVALKMILAGQLANDLDVRRFYAEAEAAAHLDHPGIVPVYEVGEYAGQHFFSMGFVEGESLDKRLAAGPLPPCQAAELVKQVAEAIAYAHQRGVIHRDLKPGNVLIDRNGQARVADFGLAKRPENPRGDATLTFTGQVLGTPAYMPPEQATGDTSQVGPLADVYALGAVLYATLTGRPPFKLGSSAETLRAVLEQEPVPPRQLNAAVPLDLNTICLKCLEKQQRRRYVSARELADELQRYSNGEPILARPITRVERAARWISRHPAAAGAYSFGVLAVLLLALSISFTWLWLKAKEAHQTAESLRQTADAARQTAEGALAGETAAKGELALAKDKLDRSAYADCIMLAQREFERGNVAVASRLLEDCDENQRGLEWGHLYLKVHEHDLATLTGHTGAVVHVTFSPDGTHLASASEDHTLRLWDMRDGKLLAALTGHTAEVRHVNFSPDGKRLASASRDNTVRVWDARDGKLLATLTGHTAEVRHVTFSPACRRARPTVAPSGQNRQRPGEYRRD